MDGFYLCAIIFSLWPSVIGHAGEHTIPKLPDRFSARMETIDTTGKRISEMRMIVDYEGKFQRTDVAHNVSSSSRRYRHFDRYGSRSLIIINDFNTGHEFVIDRYRGNCSISNISVHSQSAQVDGRHMITGMKHGFEMFLMKNMTYIGMSTIRNLPVDVYGRNGRTGRGSNGTNSTQFKLQVFFLRDPWSEVTEMGGHPVEGVPVGFNFSRFDNKTGQWVSHVNHIYDFSKDHTELGEQPMTDCFDEYQTFQIRLHGNPGGLRFVGLDVRYAMKTALAKVMRVSFIRVAIVNYLIPRERARYPYITVTFRLYEAIKKRGNLAVPVVEVSVGQAIRILKLAVSKGMNVTLPNFGQQETIKVVKSSLRTVTASTQYTMPAKTSTTATSNNGGVVAGVGVALLIVGLGVGFAAAFVLRKRFPCDKEVPYEVTA